MKIYIAAPLFNESERARNVELKDMLRALGHETYLPQEDGGIAFEKIKSGINAAEVRKEIFESDTRAIKECNVLLAVLDGRVPDEGVCIELGMAHALGKRCVGYKTDQRSLDAHGDNLMIEGCLEKVLCYTQDLKGFFLKK